MSEIFCFCFSKRENERGNRSGMSHGKAAILCNYDVALSFTATLIAHHVEPLVK